MVIQTVMVGNVEKIINTKEGVDVIMAVIIKIMATITKKIILVMKDDVDRLATGKEEKGAVVRYVIF